MKTSNKRGSALALVLIASMFLIILTAGAFRYFQTNVDTQIFTQDRIQAKLSAEAGVNLATHMLIAGASLPSDSLPQPILGTEFTPFDLPGGMGSVFVTVDPSNENDVIVTANAFRIRCIANVSGSTMETYGMESIIMPENLARFSVFMDDPSGNGYYGDGYRFDGPFYANGPINIYSFSPTHESDVFFYSFSLTSDYYVYGTNSGGSHETTPAAGNLEMRPYHRLLLGAPYFELGVDPIPFGSDELDWQGVRSAAIADGLYLDGSIGGDVPTGSRMVLKGDTLFVKKNEAAPPDTFYLGDLGNPVVWINNGAGDNVYLRGHQSQGLDMALTVGMEGSFYMSGLLNYENPDLMDPDNEILLGLMSVYGDMIIADDPEVNEPLWGGESFQIATDDSLNYSAVLVSLDGVLKAEKWWEPDPVAEFRIVGGYMIQDEGYTSTGSKGFNMAVYFDPRLLYMHPPFFPTTANWRTTMWGDKANMTIDDVSFSIPQY